MKPIPGLEAYKPVKPETAMIAAAILAESLSEALDALQDALVCLDGERYTGGPIYDEEPYAKQKKSVRKILSL